MNVDIDPPINSPREVMKRESSSSSVRAVRKGQYFPMLLFVSRIEEKKLIVGI